MMIVVMKFGGTSVADLDKIKNVSQIIKENINEYKLVVVLSAMAGATNALQKLIDQVNYESFLEQDLIITSGEQVTVGILSMLLNKEGIKSTPLLGWQVPIITDSNHEKARILNINNSKNLNCFENHDVVVLAGFHRGNDYFIGKRWFRYNSCSNRSITQSFKMRYIY